MPTILSVGGDIHQDELHLHAADKTDGQQVGKRLTVKNNRPGADQAIAYLVQLLTQHGYTQLEFGLEATGLVWLPFFTYLQQSPALTPFQPTWVCFNPKLVAKFKEGVSLSEIKDDDHDALAVAERLRFGHLPVSYVPSNEWLALRMLTRYRYRLSRQMSQEKLRALTRVFLKASEWHRGQPFSEVWGATSATLLSEFSTAEIAAMSLPQLTTLIQDYGRFANRLDTHPRSRKTHAPPRPRDCSTDGTHLESLAFHPGLGPRYHRGDHCGDRRDQTVSRSSATGEVCRLGLAQARLG